MYASSVHSKVRQEFIISHIHTIIQHMFDMDSKRHTAVTSKGPTSPTHNSQVHPQSYLLHQGETANMPLTYELVWQPRVLSPNLLFLRIEAFWGSQIYYVQIGQSGSFYILQNFEIFLRTAFWDKLTTPIMSLQFPDCRFYWTMAAETTTNQILYFHLESASLNPFLSIHNRFVLKKIFWVTSSETNFMNEIYS